MADLRIISGESLPYRSSLAAADTPLSVSGHANPRFSILFLFFYRFSKSILLLTVWQLPLPEV